MQQTHSFHIPVMGLAFTIDTPIKVSQYGIDSVLSLCDDVLIEKMRKKYCELFEVPYQEITNKIEDFRAKRITSYLDLLNEMARKKLDELKSATSETTEEIKKYFSFLPDSSTIKQEFLKLTENKMFDFSEIKNWLKDNMTMGSIDVNIMTKVDRVNFDGKEQLPVAFNDAHSGLRGFANSTLESSIILSAGMNPRLYSYFESFEDFYPNEDGYLKKKIILKVSDFRSALIQGKFLAKKGIWITEYRIESGLNCGGHAFATDGFLLGPILEEFKNKKVALVEEVNEILVNALKAKNRTIPKEIMKIKVTAQGGVGNSDEHNFLMDYYGVDAVGWGTPFLLVPEVTNVDDITMEKLIAAKEKDLFLSNISPLGVPFNSLRGDTKELEKLALIAKGRPGSPCPKTYLVSNTEYTDQPICTASRQYQRKKIKELDAAGLSTELYKSTFDKIVDKACLCVGLGTTALINNDIERKVEGDSVAICPGPNMAYFSKTMTLNSITDHIYGRKDIGLEANRPNMFVKELYLYIDYLKDRIEDNLSKKQERYLVKFTNNLNDGIDYYISLFEGLPSMLGSVKSAILDQLDQSKQVLKGLEEEINKNALAEC